MTFKFITYMLNKFLIAQSDCWFLLEIWRFSISRIGRSVGKSTNLWAPNYIDNHWIFTYKTFLWFACLAHPRSVQMKLTGYGYDLDLFRGRWFFFVFIWTMFFLLINLGLAENFFMLAFSIIIISWVVLFF